MGELKSSVAVAGGGVVVVVVETHASLHPTDAHFSHNIVRFLLLTTQPHTSPTLTVRLDRPWWSCCSDHCVTEILDLNAMTLLLNYPPHNTDCSRQLDLSEN